MKKLIFFITLLSVTHLGYSQSLSSYVFCPFDSTYVPLAGTPIPYSGGSTDGSSTYDDCYYNNIPIGFNFVYCGSIYTSLSASANCWAVLGQTFPFTSGVPDTYDDDLPNTDPTTYGMPYANLPRPILAPLWIDALSPGPNVRYSTTGPVGGRVFTIEWDSVSFYNCLLCFDPHLKVQIKLYETSNWIDFRYYQFSAGSSLTGHLGIGITGGAGPYPVTTSPLPFWSLSDASAAPVASMATNTYNIVGIPATNQVYRWMICGLTATATNNGPVCAGGNLTLTGNVAGGTANNYFWAGPGGYTSTLQNPVITGVSTLTAGIYTFTADNGCCAAISTTTVVVTAGPTPILGTTTICAGATTTLTDGTTGGTWSSSSSTTCSIGATTGIATGVLSGTATITYTLPGGCFTTTVVTVNPLPIPITGSSTVCVGASTSLTDAPGGGSWSSSSSTTATVGATTGVVTGVAIGTVTITYQLPGGCYRTFAMTVNPTPASIAGASIVCIGSAITLTDLTTGGTWSNSGTAATVAGGVVTGVSTGVSNITYTVGSCYVVHPVTVNPLPGTIGGTTLLCAGSITSLTDATTGGTWTSGTTSVATVSGAGVVTGVSGGTATISYTVGGCSTTTLVTINPLPTAISGSSSVCAGATVILTDATTGGTWGSSNTSIATISSGGIVTGIIPGVVTITYSLSTGCYTTMPFTVNIMPVAIVGSPLVCAGSTVTVSDATTGGTWSSVTTAVATISTGGVITGVSGGTSVISYTIGTCVATIITTVNPLPAAITGSLSVCLGNTTLLGETTTGGTWVSSNTSVATVVGGTVSGVGIGTSNISYTLGTGCSVFVTVTVNPLPSPISGGDSVCVGSSITLTDITTGGSWNSSSGTIATVGAATGIVNAISTGTVTITYTTASGCVATHLLTVNPIPAPISGLASLCLSESTTTLTDVSSSGVWSSSNTSIATVGSASGIVTGVSTGVVTISYTFPTTGCYVVQAVTVHPLPLPISGSDTVCVGTNTILTDATTGGSWSSSNILVATIGAGTGLLTGVSSGTVTITYTLGTGCYVTFSETVRPLPAIITGTANVCASEGTVTLTDATTGGTWSSSNTAIATIGIGTGIVTGIAAGTVTISYQLITGCYITHSFTVNPLPMPITGSDSVCIGSTTILSDVSTGGTWTSSNTAIATIVAGSGLVTGISTGLDTITFTLATGCYITSTEIVHPLPAPISGTIFSVCAGLSITLSDVTTGGTWSSSNTAIATVGTGSGIVTGVSAGTAVITYMLPTSCFVTSIVTINPLPSAIVGPTSVCLGNNIVLTDATTGGTWSSSNSAIASIGAATGVLTGSSAGTATITYTLATGCILTTIVTVNPLPNAIIGSSNVCVGSTISLTDATTGGSWSSSNTAIATVVTGSGTVTGISAGTVTITYTLATGCYVTMALTVNPLPAVIGGPLDICADGGTATLTDATTGGTWSSSNLIVATIGSVSGIITGLTPGTTIISYTLTSTTGCALAATVNVHALPTAIAGPDSLCAGTTILLTGLATGGTWSSSNTTVATVGTTSGIVNGLSAGVTTITYSVAFACFITMPVTVNAIPSASITPIGDTFICPGGFVILTANTGAGLSYQWYKNGVLLSGFTGSSYTATMTGLFSVVEFSLAGCSGTSPGMNVVIDTPVATITPPSTTTFCVSAGLTLSANTGTGLSYQWFLGGTPIVGATNSTYTAIAAGIYKVKVMNIAGCSAADSVTLFTLPAPTPVVSASGALSFCAGDSVMLTGDPGYTYQWNIGGIPISGATNISYAATLSGNYTLSETNSLGCTGTSAPIAVIANPIPVTVISASGPTTFCSGGNVALSVPYSAGYSYQWYISGIAITGANSSTYVATSSGIFSVKVVNMATGCIGVTILPVTVVLISSPVITPLTPTSFCWGSSAILGIDVIGATGVSYQWYRDGSIITGANSSTDTVNVGGNYTCVIIVTGAGGCVETTPPVLLSVFPLPNPIISLSGAILYTQNYFTSYQWYKNSTLITGATNSSLIPSGDGNYTVKVTDLNGCQSVSDVYVLTGYTGSGMGISNTSTDIDIKIFPNPANDIIYIESTIPVNAILTSLEGKQLIAQNDSKQISISELTAGTYILLIYNSEGILQKIDKIVKIE